MDVALVMSRADGSIRTFPLRKQRTVVGRTSSCDLRIPLSSVSRQHCEIVKSDDQVILRDLGSSNGTFCNDKRVQEMVLEPGDKLTVGTVQFQVVINGQPELESASVMRPPAPLSRSGRTAAGMKSPVVNTQASSEVHQDLDAELGAAIAASGGDATPLDQEDPIAALEAMASSGLVEVDEESDLKMMTEPIHQEPEPPRPSRQPRPQPRVG